MTASAPRARRYDAASLLPVLLLLMHVALQLLLHDVEAEPLQAQSPSEYACDFTRFHPRRYAAYHLAASPTQTTASEPSSAAAITIDGVLDERAWAEVPWSESFQDIQGPRFWSQPWFTTKFKLRYDDQFLYVGAYLEETEIWANVSHRNDVVFRDNDFEVFVDADSSTHNYKEFEVNARNTTWNLWLDRPYRDGGHENSTRVDPHHGFDMLGSGMRAAVFVKGQINDPSERLHYWTVEIALPLVQLALHSHAQVPPAPLSYWRVNFSRVEWPVRVVIDGVSGEQRYEKKLGLSEENWVWSAQYAVDMHRPEWWGYLQFRPRGERPSGKAVVPLDPTWSVRYLSFQFYYAQHAYHKSTGAYATHMDELCSFFSSLDAFRCIQPVEIRATNKSFRAQIAVRNDERGGVQQSPVATIRDDGYIVAQTGSRDAVAGE